MVALPHVLRLESCRRQRDVALRLRVRLRKTARRVYLQTKKTERLFSSHGNRHREALITLKFLLDMANLFHFFGNRKRFHAKLLFFSIFLGSSFLASAQKFWKAR
jgi:hypothetical protein